MDLTVHPEYDTATRTWFVPDLEFEAPTLAALQRLVGRGVAIRDYYPAGLGAAVAARYIERMTPPGAQAARPRLDPRPRRHLDFRSPESRSGRHGGHARTRGTSRYDLERILDMWAAGATSPEIGEAVGTSKTYLRVLVTRARDRGDPRAVRRNRGYENCVHDSRARGAPDTEESSKT